MNNNCICLFCKPVVHISRYLEILANLGQFLMKRVLYRMKNFNFDQSTIAHKLSRVVTPVFVLLQKFLSPLHYRCVLFLITLSYLSKKIILRRYTIFIRVNFTKLPNF